MQKAIGVARTRILQVEKALHKPLNHFDKYNIISNCNDDILIVEKQSFDQYYRY